jgi:hypothetical protein
MNNAESVRQFQPRVALWQPWENADQTMLWLQRSQMFIDFPANNCFGAPAERNLLVDE